MRTSVRSWTWSRTASALTESRTAEVAKARISSQPFSSATSSAWAVNAVSASMPASLTAPSSGPSGTRCSASRSGSL